MARSGEGILSTDFYGERTPWPVSDLLHVESLDLRSARHDWKIKPHRHTDLTQFFYVASGGGEARVDDESMTVAPGAMLVVPERAVHTFAWQPGSAGTVLFLAHPLVARVEKMLGPLTWLHGRARLLATGDVQEQVESRLDLLLTEYGARRPQRETLMNAEALALMILLDRLAQTDRPEAEPTAEGRARLHLEKFLQLLDTSVSSHHAVNWYAERIGITPTHLNNVCQRLRQQSALQVIHQRLLGEAERQLIYTGKSAAQIAEMLGFADAPYFTRFFKRMTGQTPGAYRRQHEAGNAISGRA